MKESEEQDKIAKILAKKNNIDLKEYKSVVYSQYKYAALCMKLLKPYRISFLGIWKIPKGRIEKVNEFKNNKNKKDE